MQKVITGILEFLFEGYKNNPTEVYDISVITKKHHVDAHEYGRFLLERGLIKNQMFLSDSFMCGITIGGIDLIDPNYLSESTSKIVSTLGELGGWKSVMKILDFEPKDFQRAFDLVKFLEIKGLVDYQYQFNDIQIKLTLVGNDFYEKNRANFFK